MAEIDKQDLKNEVKTSIGKKVVNSKKVYDNDPKAAKKAAGAALFLTLISVAMFAFNILAIPALLSIASLYTLVWAGSSGYWGNISSKVLPGILLSDKKVNAIADWTGVEKPTTPLIEQGQELWGFEEKDPALFSDPKVTSEAVAEVEAASNSSELDEAMKVIKNNEAEFGEAAKSVSGQPVLDGLSDAMSPRPTKSPYSEGQIWGSTDQAPTKPNAGNQQAQGQ